MNNDKPWIFRFCYKCGKKYTDKLNMEAIRKLGMCLFCDHTEGEAIEEARREVAEEQKKYD